MVVGKWNKIEQQYANVKSHLHLQNPLSEEVSLTCHTCIFRMSTVVDKQPIVGTLKKRSLSSSANQIIQQNVSGLSAKICTLMGYDCSVVPKLPAYNCCIIATPRIITHRVPLVKIPYLNSTSIGCTAIGKTHIATGMSWCRTCRDDVREHIHKCIRKIP